MRWLYSPVIVGHLSPVSMPTVAASARAWNHACRVLGFSSSARSVRSASDRGPLNAAFGTDASGSDADTSGNDGPGVHASLAAGEVKSFMFSGSIAPNIDAACVGTTL